MEVTINKVTYEFDDSFQTLVYLIMNTNSMDNNERQWWFDMMPSMNEDQLNRIQSILQTEKDKLEELEIRYQRDIANLNSDFTKEDIKDLLTNI